MNCILLILITSHSTSALHSMTQISFSTNTAEMLDTTSSEFYTSLRHGVIFLLLILSSLPFAHFLLFTSRPTHIPSTLLTKERYRMTTFPSPTLPGSPLSTPTTPSAPTSHFLFPSTHSNANFLMNSRLSLSSRSRQSSLPISLSTPSFSSSSRLSPETTSIDAHIRTLLSNPPDFPLLSQSPVVMASSTKFPHSITSFFRSKWKMLNKLPFWLRKGFLTALVYDPFHLFTPRPITLTTFLILITTTLCCLYPPLIWLVFTFAEFSESQLLTWARSMSSVCLLVLLPFAYLNGESPGHFIPFKETVYTLLCFYALLFVLYSVIPENMKDLGHILCLCVSVVYIVQPTTAYFLPFYFHARNTDPSTSIPFLWKIFWGLCTILVLILPFFSHFLIRSITILHFLILQLNGLIMFIFSGQRARSIDTFVLQLALTLVFLNYLAYLVPSLILVNEMDFWNIFFSIVLRIQYFRCFVSFVRPHGFSLFPKESKKKTVGSALSELFIQS
ncbi:hypothetical protein HMI54_007343 [Coelomomyces lativittatus]|nr:hypothetical protein HMI55_002488 [Coelomomyces lativittatus]KAJ1504194.1 hypothetical protein HMI54_007343 [Coelomomyces lativittatus]KAJ1513157.1 hypothetical protein HMI56_002943 [Coelomomyces lativittatus]